MPNTYTQLYVHFVFAVKDRLCLISPEWKLKLYKYIIGIINNNGHKTYAINGMPDHIHILVSMNPVQSASELMHKAKRDSSAWINQHHFVKGKFCWQSGYGAFTYAQSQTDKVINYILNQEKHHCKKTFIEEYIELLVKYKISYDDKYLFKEV